MGNDLIVKVFNSISANRASRKLNKNVNRSNLQNRNVNFCTAQPEELYSHNIDGNACITGGNIRIRNYLLACHVDNLFNNGYSTVVLHASNSDLVNALRFKLSSQFFEIDRQKSPGHYRYDPFIGYTDLEIVQDILRATKDLDKIAGNGQYYLEGITELMHTRTTTPYCMMYLTCPHAFIVDRVLDAQANGTLSASDTSRILSLLKQGESEKANIGNFLNEINLQSNGLIATKNELSSTINIGMIANNSNVCSIDIGNYANKHLFNLILTEIQNISRRGVKIALVLDGLSHGKTGIVNELLKSQNSNVLITVCSDDISASLESDEDTFNTFISTCDEISVLKHGSSQTCQRLSDLSGKYDKTDINYTYNNTSHKQSIFSLIPGTATTCGQNIVHVREEVIKPEMISNLGDKELFYISKKENQGIWQISLK